jgi:acyl phosphate:glycerol-3-phosphate acyltransferase
MTGLEAVPLALAFLLGSIPFGILVSRLFKAGDPRRKGSGNIGATNVARVAGKWPALLTLALDAGKGALPIVLVSLPALGEAWRDLGAALGLADAADAPVAWSPLMVWSTGLFAVLGHCFSPWLHFKGGKGVATGLGAALVLSPIAALFGAIAFVAMFLSTRVGSLSSISGLLACAIAHMALYPSGAHLWAGAAMILVVLLRHEANIDALLENRERSFR